MKKILLSGFWILFIPLSFATKSNSKDDNTYFVYSEGISSRNVQEKILLVSSNILTFMDVKTVRDPLGGLLLTLAFIEKIDKIANDERIDGAPDYYNLHFGTPIIERIDGDVAIPSSYRIAYGILGHDSKLMAMEKIRQGIINSYLNRGYRIYQVDFNPMDHKDIHSNNIKDDEGNPLVYLPQLKLSELWVPAYRPGAIRSRMIYLGNNSIADGNR